MRKCPFCAEEIQDQAVKCRFCNEFIIDAELKKTADLKWYHRTGFVVFSVLCFGPMALPLVWFNPQYKPVTKVIVSILIILLTLGICIAAVETYVIFLDQLEKMGL